MKKLFLLLLLWTIQTQAATIYVTTTKDIVAQDGQCSLREAVRAANQNQQVDTCRTGSGNSPDIIQLSSQTYSLDFNPLEISENVIITGSGITRTVITGQQRTRLFFVQPEVHLQLQDLTLTEAKTSHFGAAIGNFGGILTIYNCLITKNIASGSSSAGGAIFNYGGTVNLNYAQFIENMMERGYGGGAIFNYQGYLNVENSQFIDNQAITGFGGAGIYNSEGVVNVLNSSFSGNQASFGGGFFNWDGVANLANVTFSGNQASFGGAIDTYKGLTYLTHATIVNNTAIYSGGIDNDGQVFLTASIVANNQAKSGVTGCHSGTNSQIYTGAYNAFTVDNGCEKQVTDIELMDITNQLDTTLQLNQATQGTPLTHALREESVLIDAIPEKNCFYISQLNGYNPLFTHKDRVFVDQRNAIRAYQQACDIGAYEFAAMPPSKPAKAPHLPVTYYLVVQVEGDGRVSSHPTGIDCDGTCRVGFHENTDLVLTALADSGAKLVAWEGDCNDSSHRLTRSLVVEPPVNQTVRLNMNRNKQCTVIFGK